MAIAGAGADSGSAQRLAAAAEACQDSLLEEHQTEEAFAPLLKAGLEVPLQVCYLSAVQSHLDECSVAIFMLNNLACLEASLRPYKVLAGSQVESIAAQMETHLGALVSTQVSLILTACGLVQPYRTVQSGTSATQRMADIDGCSAQELSSAFSAFYNQLFSTAGPGAAGGAGRAEGTSRIFEACAKIQTPRLRAEARTKIVEGVIECYTALFDAVHDSSSGYVDPSSIAVHKPSAVRMVLQ